MKKKSKDQSVGLYFIQQLYPKFMRSKEFKAALAAVPTPVPKGKKTKKVEAPGNQANIKDFFTKKVGSGRGDGISAWRDALKAWNGKRSGQWCVPRKGTPEYTEVRAIMAASAPKAKKGRKVGGSRDKLSWVEALKIWNKSHGGVWCIPKKGSAGYDEVIGIMNG